MQTFLFAGAVNAFIAVALGAFAAHGLSARLEPAMLDVFKTGAHYHLIHSLALVLIALLVNCFPARGLLLISGWAFIWGICFFSFSLYALALSGIGFLGAITPIGGLGFLVGWASLAIFAFNLPSNN